MSRRDLLRLDERLERIEGACDWLDALAKREPDDVLQSVETVAAMERILEVAVQAAIDIAGRFIATRGWQTPESYGQAFRILQEHGLLEPELAGRLRLAAGLRNALAHDYLDIDHRRLHAQLPEDIADLRAFCAAVVASVSEEP